MSVISFGICALLLISAIAAMPAPGPFLLSTTIQNKNNVPIRCTVSWQSVEGPLLEKDILNIPSYQSKVVKGRNIDMGAWTAFAHITNIQCGSLSLSQPFPGVTDIVTEWVLAVDKKGITSVGKEIVNE